MEAVYAPVLPRHQHPWIYLALELDPTTVDVNVHPTKMEVQFLNEELIAQHVQEALLQRLRERGGSRTFDIQTTMLGAGGGKSAGSIAATTLSSGGASARGKTGGSIESGMGDEMHRGVAEGKAPREPKPVVLNPQRVRTDHRQQSLDLVWRSSQLSQTPAGQVEVNSHAKSMDVDQDERRKESFEEAQQLTSICALKAAYSLAADTELSQRLNASVYIGAVNQIGRAHV